MRERYRRANTVATAARTHRSALRDWISQHRRAPPTTRRLFHSENLSLRTVPT